MADRNLALSLIISAKDAASAVIARVRSAVSGAAQESSKYAADTDKAAGSNSRFADSLGGVTTRLGGLAAAYLSINGLKTAFESVLSVGGKFETLSIQINNLMGGIQQGEAATQWIKDFAKNTPLELEGVTKAFVRLKAFGLDPMDGTLQALTDLNAKLGGGQAELEGIVLAVGQAWSKQKLQAEEVNQLVERGVPVWDMLAKVTGKNTAELQKLAEQGALGRDVIRALIDEIGRSSEGSSAAMMSTWAGLISNLSDSWTNFLGDLAKNGVLDQFKAQLVSIQAIVAAMASSESLKNAFSSIGSFVIGTAKAIEVVAVSAAFAVDQLGRGVGALAAKLAALATLDFAGIEAIDKAFGEDNQKAIEQWTQLINNIKSPPPVEVKTNFDSKPVEAGLKQVSIDVDAAIKSFQDWDKQSTATVSNVATELRKLSDVELANLKATLEQAFTSGTNSSAELQKALAAIKTEDLSRAWKTLGQQSSKSLKEASQSAKAAYITIRDSGTATAKELDKAWAAVTQQIISSTAAANAANDVEKQRKANILELNNIGATPEEKSANRRKELTDQTYAYEKARREGDYAEAARIAQEKEKLAFDNARADTEAAKAGEIAGYRAYDAKKAYLKAIKDTNNALEELSKQEQKNNQPEADQSKESLKQQQEELEKMQATIDLLRKPINLEVKANFAEAINAVDQLQQRINALNSSIATAGQNAGTVEQALSTEVLKRGSRT